MARSNTTWLADLAAEMQRPANDVIRELLATYSTFAAANIIGVSQHTLRRHCERAGIELQPGKRSPDRKPHRTGYVNHRTRLLEVGGVSLPLAEWARLTGIARGTIRMRLELGWPGERAVTEEPGLPYQRKGAAR